MSAVNPQHLKRALDAVGGAILLLVTLPLQLAAATVVALTLGRPVLFEQPRPGRDGRVFTLKKFRTMRPAALPGEQDADRLTRIGKLLRATSIDELPSLWNVLVGEMSFVGPRPLLVDYLPLYTPRQARRHAVRPGITGLAQVNGRNALGWEERLELDVRYVESWSLGLDARILAQTVGVVLRRSGITAPGEATMTRFPGSSAGGQKGRDDVADAGEVVLGETGAAR